MIDRGWRSDLSGIRMLRKVVAKSSKVGRNEVRIPDSEVGYPSASIRPTFRSTIHKGICMKRTSVASVAVVTAAAVLTGCQDLKPMESDVAWLKQQMVKTQSDVAAVKTSADQANMSAQSAAQAASAAQSTSNQALSAAQAAQSASRETDSKVDRMFKRSLSK
jgi:murein lipoprotein